MKEVEKCLENDSSISQRFNPYLNIIKGLIAKLTARDCEEVYRCIESKIKPRYIIVIKHTFYRIPGDWQTIRLFI